MPPDPFESALNRFDEMNLQDPRHVDFCGKKVPREWLHALKLHGWVLKLDPAASLELRIASRCNAVRRWEIPRETYPKTTSGYHKWRMALRKFHAELAEKVLGEEGFDPNTVARVRALILMENFPPATDGQVPNATGTSGVRPQDGETQILEDADCLTFLETKFHEYIGQWDEAKTVRILKGTLKKMSPAAKALALGLPLSPDARGLIQKALES